MSNFVPERIVNPLHKEAFADKNLHLSVLPTYEVIGQVGFHVPNRAGRQSLRQGTNNKRGT
jgi:hypothetical protein